ncbi:unnamed protein product [Symbiodinium natans]|uniref:C3H1-type domain-containing protein n=1 Tax=Symbiodinium natans TaxID=878477 RepID=A0A812MZ15_9DINO|nr:unnamed protein product [Symbiodinium natans]
MAAVRSLYGEDMVRGDASQRQAAMPWMLQQGRLDPSGLDSVSAPWMGLQSQGPSGSCDTGLPSYMHQDMYPDVNNYVPMAAEGFSNNRQVLGEKPKESLVDKTAFRQQFKKTQMCRFFQRSACRKGDLCEFAHGTDELTQAPDLRRTSLCKAFMEGCCPESAETCRFAHGIALLRRTPGFEKLVGSTKAKPANEDAENEEHSQLHEMLKKQQREQDEMRRVIEEQRRRINELKMQQEQLQIAQYTSALQSQLPLAPIPSIVPQPNLLPKLGTMFPHGYEKTIPL